MPAAINCLHAGLLLGKLVSLAAQRERTRALCCHAVVVDNACAEVKNSSMSVQQLLELRVASHLTCSYQFPEVPEVRFCRGLLVSLSDDTLQGPGLYECGYCLCAGSRQGLRKSYMWDANQLADAFTAWSQLSCCSLASFRVIQVHIRVW